VLGSRGSLLAVLAQQMRNDEPITVTHPDVTRFFMTIEEAVGLVLEAAHLARGGETFVLDMGQPVRIVDLVENYARQIGFGPHDIRYTGLRPGEKLHEALFASDEEQLPTAHPRIRSTSRAGHNPRFDEHLEVLFEAASRNAVDDVKRQLGEILGNYERAVDGARSATAVLYPDDF
jgi:FlaA1/EpsC-like NDP-sugar epimerase